MAEDRLEEVSYRKATILYQTIQDENPPVVMNGRYHLHFESPFVQLRHVNYWACVYVVRGSGKLFNGPHDY